MKLSLESIVNHATDWTAAGVKLPSHDIAAMRAATAVAPEWVHFGAGNIFRGFVGSQLVSDGSLFLGIRSLALGGRHVGNIKLAPIDRRHGQGEIGVLVGEPEAWGRGLASGAIAQLASIAREELGLRKLTAGCYASNAGSERAFVKAGFAVEGRRPAHFLLDGRPEDLVLMGRLL